MNGKELKLKDFSGLKSSSSSLNTQIFKLIMKFIFG